MTLSIRYQVINESQFQEASAFFYELFLKREPLESSLGCGEKWKVWDDLIQSGLQSNLSVCAVDESTNEMVGIFICFITKMDEIPNKPPSLQEYIANGYSRAGAELGPD